MAIPEARQDSAKAPCGVPGESPHEDPAAAHNATGAPRGWHDRLREGRGLSAWGPGEAWGASLRGTGRPCPKRTTRVK